MEQPIACTLDLKPAEEGLVLDIAGPQDAQPIIAELFSHAVTRRRKADRG